MKKYLLLLSSLLILNGCQTIDRIKGNKPTCKSYNYSSFMGKPKDYLLAAKIYDEYVIIENGQDVGPRNDKRVAFYIENGIVSGIGCY